MEEIWKYVYINGEKTHFQISNYGRARSLLKPKIKYLKLNTLNNRGYKMLSIRFNGKMYSNSVHRLVAYCFLGLQEGSKLHVNHKDLNKLNNNVNNLELVTHEENIKHAMTNGVEFGHKTKKFNKEEINYIRNSDKTARQISKMFGVGINMVYHIRNYRRYNGANYE